LPVPIGGTIAWRLASEIWGVKSSIVGLEATRVLVTNRHATNGPKKRILSYCCKERGGTKPNSIKYQGETRVLDSAKLKAKVKDG
jgi:hypothetical protein